MSAPERVVRDAYPCGCPIVPGQPVLDWQAARHRDFHVLVREQTGIPLGTPVNFVTVGKARGLVGGTGATSPGATDLKRQRQGQGGNVRRPR